MLPKLKEYALPLVFFISLLFGFFALKNQAHNTPTIPQNQAVKATVSTVVKNAPKVEIAPKKPIKVYKNSQAIKNKLKLPQNALDNASAHVLSSVQTPKTNHSYTITTTLDEQTGQTETYIKQNPKPILDLDLHSEIALYAGIKNGNPAVRLQAYQNIINIKNMNIGAIATIDQSQNANTDYFIGVGVKYQW